MRGERIAELKAEVRRVGTRLDELLASLGKFEDQDGRAFDISLEIPGTDSSVSDIRARHAVLAGLVAKFDSKDAGSTVPLSFFVSALNALRSITNTSDQIDAEITSVRNNGGLINLDPTSFVANTANGSQFNFGGHFKTLFDNSETFVIAFHNLFQAVNPSRASFNFSAATESLSSIISGADATRRKLNESLRSAQSKLDAFTQKDSELAATLVRTNADATAITEITSRSSEAFSQIENYRDRAKEVSTAASSLSDTVEEFSDQFADFEKKLSARNSRFETGTSLLDDLTNELTEQREFIRTIIEQSDNMLSSATIAGLSSEFKSIKDDLTIQLEKAYKTFGWSILLLFISAIPLIIFIFAPFIAPFMSNNDKLINSIASAGTERSGWQYVGQVIARFIILLPALWFVTFTTARYNSLFKLREHYAYKYSIAMAVDGFKKTVSWQRGFNSCTSIRATSF